MENLKIFFPEIERILFTVGRRTPEGVAKGDIVALDSLVQETVEETLRDASEKEIYEGRKCKGKVFCQIVPRNISREERENQVIQGIPVKDYHIIATGGLPNLDAMVSQHPGKEWDYPYTIDDMKKARVIPGRTNIVWGYPEAAKEAAKELEEEIETWEEMLRVKQPLQWTYRSSCVQPLFKRTAFQWTLLKVYPSGKIREIFKVDEVPSDLIHDAVLIRIGRGLGVHPYSDKSSIVVIGGRGGSTALGNMIVGQITKIKGSLRVLEEINTIVEERPSKTRALLLVIDTWLEKGKPVKVGEVIEYQYL